MKHPFTAPIVAEVFTKEIIRLHGTPISIVSDRDKVFLSLFWREIFKIQEISLEYSIAYHPQSHGQTEVVNKCLEFYLRCFINGKPRTWSKWLHWENTGTTPELHPLQSSIWERPPQLTKYNRGQTPVSTVEEQLVERDAILDDLEAHLLKSQHKMKLYEDGKRREVNLEVGDMVYLKLQPYR